MSELPLGSTNTPPLLALCFKPTNPVTHSQGVSTRYSRSYYHQLQVNFVKCCIMWATKLQEFIANCWSSCHFFLREWKRYIRYLFWSKTKTWKTWKSKGQKQNCPEFQIRFVLYSGFTVDCCLCVWVDYQICVIQCREGACKLQLSSLLDEHGRSETDINPQVQLVICWWRGNPARNIISNINIKQFKLL